MKLNEITIVLDQLLLDPNNPRFADISDDTLNIPRERYIEEAIQKQAYDKMMNPKFDVISLANSIMTVGFYPVDKIVTSKIDTSNYVVIEGNRRTAALKYILRQHELGQTTLSAEEIADLSNISIMVVDEQEEQLGYIGKIIQGIRNVSGIKEWEAFQKAQFINDMIDKGKEPGNISKMIGMQVKEINRYYRTYQVMLNFKRDEEYGSKWKPNYFSYFDEILKKPALREFLGWNPDDFIFENISNLKRLYDWILPDDDKNSTINDAKEVRRLPELIYDHTALTYLDDKNLQKAINYIEQKNFNTTGISITECISRIHSAIDGFKNLIAESLENEINDEEIDEIEKGINDMKTQLSRVKTLRTNGQ
jgi:hypothetical protein